MWFISKYLNGKYCSSEHIWLVNPDKKEILKQFKNEVKHVIKHKNDQNHNVAYCQTWECTNNVGYNLISHWDLRVK